MAHRFQGWVVAKVAAGANSKDLFAPEPGEPCPVCGTAREPGHSCPSERSEWEIPLLSLHADGVTGKVTTPDAEFVVQWDRDSRCLDVLVDEGRLLIQPVGCNAIWLRVEEETD